MKAIPTRPEHYDFNFPDLDTLVRVEVHSGDVTIRTTRDSFSPRRRRAFVHELAAEGFIPEDLDWSTICGSSWKRKTVTWTVDTDWLEPDAHVKATSRALVVKLVSGSVVALGLLLGLVFSGHLGSVRVGLPAPATAPAASR